MNDGEASNFFRITPKPLSNKAMDAWAKSGEKQGAQRAQQIHDGMVELYRQTNDPEIAPSTISFNTLLNAWSKSQDPSASEMAEKILNDMIEWEGDEVQPDVLTFSTILDTYAKSDKYGAIERSEELFDLMDKLGVQRNVYTYSALQNVYAKSGRPDAAERCKEVLDRMIQLYHNGDVFAKPNCVNYNSVLVACSRINTKESADKANDMLEKIERSVFEGGYDIEPDRLSYALTILACARCPDVVYGAELAERNLEKMEARTRIEAKRREEISSAAPPAVTLDLESFNVVLTAISKTRLPNAVTRAIKIVTRMEEYSKNGFDSIAPNTRSWNAILQALSRSDLEDRAKKAERILDHMFELHEQGVEKIKPDAYTFSSILSMYHRMGTPSAIQRADDILRHMEVLYEKGVLDAHPDVFHYTVVCAGWAKSEQKRAAPRAVEILTSMKEKDRLGVPHIRPSVRTYNACLDALCRAGDNDKAEQLLYHMLDLARNGDKEAFPDSFSFNCVINGFSRARNKDSGQRAESILERFLEFSEEFPKVKPDTRSFTHIISHYRNTKKMPDAPYRAEYVLNRLISMFVSGHKDLVPNVFSFTTVMDCYSDYNHPDAGETAERLVRTMRKLQREHHVAGLKVNTGLLNTVLYAWSCCGRDDAGQRASALLRDMETKADEGDSSVQPNARSYVLVMIAWSKVNSSDKAVQAFQILRQMRERKKQGKVTFPLNDYPHSVIINACCFTNGNKEEGERAFQIAVKTMTELIRGEVTSSSITFARFFQVCQRLNVDQAAKEENLERAFQACCDLGLVNDFALQRFKAAASDELFRKMLISSIPSLASQTSKGDTQSLKEQVELAHLPTHWRRSREHAAGKSGRTKDRVGKGRRVTSKRKVSQDTNAK